MLARLTQMLAIASSLGSRGANGGFNPLYQIGGVRDRSNEPGPIGNRLWRPRYLSPVTTCLDMAEACGSRTRHLPGSPSRPSNDPAAKAKWLRQVRIGAGTQMEALTAVQKSFGLSHSLLGGVTKRSTPAREAGAPLKCDRLLGRQTLC